MKIESVKIQGQDIPCAKINLIIGPNNSGKSTLIKELVQALSDCEISETNKWIEELTIETENSKLKFDEWFPTALSEDVFQKTTDKIKQMGVTNVFGGFEWNDNVFKELQSKLDQPLTYKITKRMEQNREWHFFRLFTKIATQNEPCLNRLQGPYNTKIDTIGGQSYTDIVQYLFAENKIFDKISQHIEGVFGIKIVFDDLEQGNKSIRIAPEEAIDKSLSRKDQWNLWDKTSPTVDNQGDGLKAYLKLVYGLFNPPKEIILIDEPEAFLHSPQRRSLGRFIADNAEGGTQIFIATHDSEFLRGIIAGNRSVDTQIIYLKEVKSQRVFKINKVDSRSAKSHSYNELILNAYFNRLTILCEAEDDRVIYQYASQRYYPNESIDAHFIGLNGKSAVFASFKNLRSLDINTCIVVDVDVLYSGECVALFENDEKTLFKEVQEELNKDIARRENFKKNGLSAIADTILSGKVSRCIQLAKEEGIFIIESGAIESFKDNPSDTSRQIQNWINEIDSNPLTPKKELLKEFLRGVLIFDK